MVSQHNVLQHSQTRRARATDIDYKGDGEKESIEAAVELHGGEGGVVCSRANDSAFCIVYVHSYRHWQMGNVNALKFKRESDERFGDVAQKIA